MPKITYWLDKGDHCLEAIIGHTEESGRHFWMMVWKHLPTDGTDGKGQTVWDHASQQQNYDAPFVSIQSAKSVLRLFGFPDAEGFTDELCRLREGVLSSDRTHGLRPSWCNSAPSEPN